MFTTTSLLAMASAIAFIVTFFLTGYIRRYALNKKILDIPNHRSSHSSPTPRGGGLSIIICLLLSYGILLSMDWLAFDLAMGLILGCLIVAGIGWLDDHGHVSPPARLLAHLMASCLIVGLLGGMPEMTFGSISVQFTGIGYLIAIIGLVWLLNLTNFMDGIDGIASVQVISTLFSSIVVVFLNQGQIAPEFLLISTVSMAAVAGFLAWNWPPAKIFMGDAGSGYLGWMVGAIALWSAHQDWLSLWCWLILFSVFIVDATYTLLVRMISGQTWLQAHRSHTYQILSRRYASHKKVTLLVLYVNLFWLLPIASLASYFENFAFLFCLLAWIPLVFIAWKNQAGKFND